MQLEHVAVEGYEDVVTAEDVGTTTEDMAVVREVTSHVTGLSAALGGLGDPSPWTARGVVAALRGWQRHRDARVALAGLHVVVLGVGKVGSALARLLADQGCRLTLADPDTVRVLALGDELSATGGAIDVTSPRRAHTVPCDVLAPCALGGLLDEQRVTELACRAVIGSANDQLGWSGAPAALVDRGIDHVPDYVANAGGVLCIAEELADGDRAGVARRVERIEATTLEVLATAAEAGVPPDVAANAVADARVAASRAGAAVGAGVVDGAR